MVKQCTNQSWISAQGKVIWGNGWYDGQDEKNSKKKVSNLSSLEAKFLVWGFEVAQKTWPPENSPNKKCCHVGNHVIFSSMIEVLH